MGRLLNLTLNQLAGGSSPPTPTRKIRDLGYNAESPFFIYLLPTL